MRQWQEAVAGVDLLRAQCDPEIHKPRILGMLSAARAGDRVVRSLVAGTGEQTLLAIVNRMVRDPHEHEEDTFAGSTCFIRIAFMGARISLE